MFKFIAPIFLFFLAAAMTAGEVKAQSDTWPPFPDASGRRPREEESQMIKEMLAKQQSEREKKEYRILLERGEAALNLSNDLKKTFEKAKQFTSADEKRLADLEKIVLKIRDDLGAGEETEESLPGLEERPKDLRQAVNFLTQTTEKLVDELKKSTRFSVSVVAIESSNAVIKLVRFLRFRN